MYDDLVTLGEWMYVGPGECGVDFETIDLQVMPLMGVRVMRWYILWMISWV